ncbi:MAG: sodium:solute symporter [Burkholderiaceae bacterium]|nr:sodium:solute symporter [Burkholderiaceae bacterium]
MSPAHRVLCVIAFILLAVCPPVRAENLASVRLTALPALPAIEPLQALVAIDGRPLALGQQNAWLLSEDQKSWTPTNWQAPAPLLAVVSGGAHAYALMGAEGRVQRTDRLTLVQGQPTLAPLPPLPTTLALARGTGLAGKLYIAGLGPDGLSRVLQIDPQAKQPAWRELAGWPGAGQLSSLVGQTAALFATFASDGQGAERMLRWSADRGWTEQGAVPGRVVAGSGRAMGQAHVLYLVQAGAEGAPKLMSFHTITGAWAVMAAPEAGGVSQTAAWNNGVLWARPGADGSQTLAFAEVEAGKQLLRWLDWLVIAIYLVAMLGIGLYFYLREKRDSTADFFVGGRSIPFWVAGVSLYATNTSSISFIAIPAKAFETNWQYLTNNLIAVLGLMFVAVWIVPLLRRLDLMSVFSYLETRFHPAIRMLASALCILMQVGSRMSVVLFLPALAIATITGLNVVWSILIMGGFTIAYTAMGGMKAVVWTDFVQVFAMMGGALFAIGFIVYRLNGGFDELWQVAMAENKTQLFDFSFDLTKATVWGFIFLVLFDVVLTFPKDQVLMQRTLSTESAKEAGRSIWAFAAIMIPGGFVFYSIGTALYVFYRAHPERMNPLLSIDATFPLFIAAELPMGVTGLIIAGIFAAAMSTLSSIINSVATLASVDFYEKLAKNPTPRKSVLFAEVITVVVGLAGIGVALLLSRYDIHSLFDVSIELAGLLGGGFAGAYTLGMFTRRANSPGVAIGIASSIALTTLAWAMNLVHPYFYLAISIMLCIIIGYVASLFFPAPTRSLKGLTIYSDVGHH